MLIHKPGLQCRNVDGSAGSSPSSSPKVDGHSPPALGKVIIALLN